MSASLWVTAAIRVWALGVRHSFDGPVKCFGPTLLYSNIHEMFKVRKRTVRNENMKTKWDIQNRNTENKKTEGLDY